MTPARQRRQRSAWMTVPPIPYLGTGLVTAEPVKAGVVRQFRRPDGHDFLGFQQTALRRLADAERPLPGLLDDILACARAADPLLLYSRLIVLSGMRRAVPGHISFGMDAMKIIHKQVYRSGVR